MKIVSSFDTPRVWYRTEHDDHEAVWVTDWTDGAWIVIADGEYLRPNLVLWEAFAQRPECMALWGAVAAEFNAEIKKVTERVRPGCGAVYAV